MNRVDFLLKSRFGSLPLEDKLEIKRLGPHQPADFNIIQSGKDVSQPQPLFQYRLVDQEETVADR